MRCAQCACGRQRRKFLGIASDTVVSVEVDVKLSIRHEIEVSDPLKAFGECAG